MDVKQTLEQPLLLHGNDGDGDAQAQDARQSSSSSATTSTTTSITSQKRSFSFPFEAQDTADGEPKRTGSSHVSPVSGSGRGTTSLPFTDAPPPPPAGISSTTTRPSGGDENNTNPTNQINESYAVLSPFQWMLLGVSVLHTTTIRILIHLNIFTRHPLQLNSFHRFEAVTDVIRLLLCILLEVYRETIQRGQSMHIYDSLLLNFYHHPRDSLRPAVVLVLVWIQTRATLEAMGHISPYLASVLSFHGTILGAAALSLLVLGYRYTRKQWICLILLVLGVYIASVPNETHVPFGESNWMQGLSYVMMALISGSLALVYFERVLKQDLALVRADPPPASFWMRGVQISLYSLILHLLQSYMYDDNDETNAQNLSIWAWFCAPIHAMGMLIFMSLLKYGTAVHEKCTLSTGFVVSLLLNFWIFDLEQTSTVALYTGTTLTLVAVYLFGQPVPDIVQTMVRQALQRLPQQQRPYEPLATGDRTQQQHSGMMTPGGGGSSVISFQEPSA